MKDIKIYGASCPDCRDTKLVVADVIRENGIKAKVQRIEDITEILKKSVFTIPAVAIDGEIVIEGRCPTKEELMELLMD